jgi:hypothetical protein
VRAPLKACRALRLARAAHFRFVGLNGFAFAAKARCSSAGVHCQPDTVAKEPSGFHAAIEHPLNLARRDAFLARAEQMDDLRPQVQGKVAVLKQRAHTHRKGLLAGVAFVQPRTGRLAVQTANPCRLATVRAYGAIRPKAGFHIRESALFGQELRGVQNRLGHRNLQWPQH